jgi:prepilin-type N-terminal cleavage/methylation domain-containing protein
MGDVGLSDEPVSVRSRRAHRDAGFTLVEVLVVIVILGILSAVAVFSIRGIGDNGQAAACAAERSVLNRAEETALAAKGAYLDTAGLRTSGFLATAPSHHTVTAPAGSFSITADATCLGTTAAPTTTVAATTTVAPTTTLAPTTTVTPTTTTEVPSNGVTMKVTGDASNKYYGEDRIYLTNTDTVSALTITINVARTTNLTYHGMYTDFWGGISTMSNDTGKNFVTYTFTLDKGQTMVPGSWTIVAQWDVAGGIERVTSEDTWSVTSTSGKVSTTNNGTF